MPKYVKKNKKIIDINIPLTNSSEFHNQKIIEEISNWIKNFQNKNTSKKALIIHGMSGIGKTVITKLICKEMGYLVHYYDSSIVRNKKWINDIFSEVFNLTFSFCKNNRIIIIDDMDGFTNTNDFGGISELVKQLNPLKGRTSITKKDKENRDKLWKNPVILICNNILSNKFSDLIKECDSIYFPYATEEELFQIAKKYKYLKRDVKPFVSQCKGDVRYFINNICFYKSQNKINVEKENIDTFLYDRITDVFNNSYDDKEIAYNFYQDPSMFPSLINENIYNNIDPENSNYIEDISIISEFISHSDILHSFIQNKMCYNLDDIYCYLSVISPIYYMKRVQSSIPIPIKFPVVLGKNAVIYANKTAMKNYYILSNHICHIDHFVYLRKKILTFLNDDSEIERAFEVMLYYNINPDTVFSSLKVKLFSKLEFKNLTNVKYKTKIKSKFNQLLQYL